MAGRDDLPAGRKVSIPSGGGRCLDGARSGRLSPEIRIEPAMIGVAPVAEVELHMDRLGTLAAHRERKLGVKSLYGHGAGLADLQFGHAPDPGAALGDIREHGVRLQPAAAVDLDWQTARDAWPAPPVGLFRRGANNLDQDRAQR